MYLTSMDEPGLVLLPTHRVWRGEAKDWLGAVGEHFRVEDFPATPEGERALLARLADDTARGVPRLAPARSRLSAALAGASGWSTRRWRTCTRWCAGSTSPSSTACVLRRLLGIDCTRAAQEGELTYTHDGAQALHAVAREGAGGRVPAALAAHPGGASRRAWPAR